MTGYQSKKKAASAKTIDEVNWADHEPDGLAHLPQESVVERAWFTIDELNAWVDKKLAENPHWVMSAEEPERKEALAQPEQEPHSWYSKQVDEWMTNKTRKEHERLNSYTHKLGKFDLPLYTTPPQPALEQNFCPRCGKRTKDIHTCTPPQENNNE